MEKNIEPFLFISQMLVGDDSQFMHQQQPSPPVALPQPAQSQPLKRKKKKDKPVSQACIICSHDHASCDDSRPCKRCTTKGFPHLCKNAVKAKPAKKGRPARALNKYTSIVQEAESEARTNLQASTGTIYTEAPVAHTVYPSMPDGGMVNYVNNYDGIITTSVVEQYLSSGMTAPPSYPGAAIFSIPSPSSIDTLFANAASNSLDLFAFQPIEDRSVTVVHSTPSLPATPEVRHPEMLLPPPEQERRIKQLEVEKKSLEKVDCDEDDCECLTNEAGIQRLLGQLSLRANVSDSVPEMRSVTSKVKALRNVMLKNITTLEENFQSRFMSVQSHCLQLSLPVIMCCGLSIIAVNPAACELFRMSKAEIIAKKFLFNLLAPGDLCIAFMKKWADAVVDYVDLDRMRVKVEVFGGILYECIMNATVYREPSTGCPLLETYMFVRVDDV